MATGRISCIFRFGRSGLLQVHHKTRPCSALVTKIHKVNLTSTHGEPDPNRAVPWPYKKRPFNMFWQFFDSTLKRMGENSKVIVVDGNLAVGKSEFAQKIAKEFDLKYFPDLTVDELFDVDGFDMRELNEQLPLNLQSCDLAYLYKTTDPKKAYSMGKTQLLMYANRMMYYLSALEHLFNTGQGVVLERSVFSDIVFAETLRKYGYYTKAGFNFYNVLRDNSICELWRPHLIIYLDAPLSHIRDQINKRNTPYEVNSPVLTDDYLSTIDSLYKKKFLPEMRKTSAVLQYDVTNLPDWDMIVEELEELDLDSHREGEDDYLLYWTSQREDDWSKYRLQMHYKWQWANLFVKPVPWDAPELIITDDDALIQKNVILEHPALKYKKGYDPFKNSTLLKW